MPALRLRWLTPAYDLVVAATTRERTFKQALVEQTAPSPGHEILDLGCGTGTLAIWLKRRYPACEVTGIDGDPQVLAIASRKAARAGVSIRLEEGLSFALPHADGSFERVVSSLFFHHLDAAGKLATVREAHRVLRPGGELHVADWGRAGNPALRAAFVAVQLLDGFANTADNVRGRLPAVFAEAGFVGATESRAFATPLGTLSLYHARKQGAPAR